MVVSSTSKNLQSSHTLWMRYYEAQSFPKMIRIQIIDVTKLCQQLKAIYWDKSKTSCNKISIQLNTDICNSQTITIEIQSRLNIILETEIEPLGNEKPSTLFSPTSKSSYERQYIPWWYTTKETIISKKKKKKVSRKG